MKKSRHIQLVLITAALSACNRQFIPPAGPGHEISDSTLTAGNPLNDSVSCLICCQNNQNLWNYSFNPFGNNSFGIIGRYYYDPEKRYKSIITMKGTNMVVQGGWGKTATAISVSS
jgi:hypothetical protein